MCTCKRTCQVPSKAICKLISKGKIIAHKHIANKHGALRKGSSISWVAKLKGDKNSECKLPREMSGRKFISMLRWNFITHGFLDPFGFPEITLQVHELKKNQGFFKEGYTSGGGLNWVNVSFCVFPCFAVFGSPKIPNGWEKQHEKCHCHTPFCVPHMRVKTRI